MIKMEVSASIGPLQIVFRDLYGWWKESEMSLRYS